MSNTPRILTLGFAIAFAAACSGSDSNQAAKTDQKAAADQAASADQTANADQAAKTAQATKTAQGTKMAQPVTTGGADVNAAAAPPAVVAVAKQGKTLVRFVNALPGEETTVDLNGAGHTLFADQDYKAASGYVEVTGNEVAFDLLRHVGGTNLATIHQPLVDGNRYTFIAMRGKDAGVRLRVYLDDLKPAAGKARIRVINAAPLLKFTDVAFQGMKGPLFEGVDYESDGKWKDIAPQTVSVELWRDVKGDVPVVIKNVKFVAGKAYTIVLTGNSDTPLQAIMFTDMMPDAAPPQTAQLPPAR